MTGHSIRHDLIRERVETTMSLKDTLAALDDEPLKTYRATYKQLSHVALHTFVDFDARGFAAAVWTAEHARNDGEQLVNVRAIEDLDSVNMACA